VTSFFGGPAAKQIALLPSETADKTRPGRRQEGRREWRLTDKFAHDSRPMPTEMMVAQHAEEMKHHATMAGFSEVGLHGGKLS
jgi:hypothetical protein